MYKKLLCFLSFFILLFLFTTKIFAFDQFIKYEENPLQLKIDTKYSTIRQAHLYKIENSYEGVITLFDSFKNKFILSSISSLDGINWKFKKEIFINDESQEFSNPRVFIDENGNKHLFFAKLENNNILQIYYLKCDKDFNCQNPPKLIITPDSDENSGVFAPYVIKIGNIFYIFYGSWGQRGFSIRIGYSSTNLENWEKCPKKILSGYYDGPFILQENNSIYLFYHRSDKQGIGYAETSLPLNCDSVFNDKGIILTPTQTYDQNHLIYPSLIKKIEKRIGRPVVETFKGGTEGGGGMKLTPMGKYLLRKYNRFESFVRHALENSELWEACGFSIPDKNRLSGKIVKVEMDDATAYVQIELKKPFTLTSIITTNSTEDLEIEKGSMVEVFIKSTEVMVDKQEQATFNDKGC
jgi:molybdopterin-binding protein